MSRRPSASLGAVLNFNVRPTNMTRYCILFLFLILPVAAFACVAKDPVATARWIYEHANDFDVYKKGSPQYISPELFSLLERDWKCQEPGDVCEIESDPWTGAQDGYVLNPIKYRMAAQEQHSATVEMSFTLALDEHAKKGESKTVQIKLVHPTDDGCWLLDDIVHGKDSFKTGLATWPYYGAQ